MRKTLPLILSLFLFVFSLQGQTPGAGSAACDRGCLAQFLTQGCDNIKTQRIPRLSGITYRVGAVDEEQGIVWLRQDFGPGSVMGQNGATGSLTCWEMFKVYGGSIHAVEAFMKVMPQGKPSGWDAK